MMRRYLLAWAFLAGGLITWLAVSFESLEGLVTGDPGVVHHAQLNLAQREPHGSEWVLLFGDSVTVVKNTRDPADQRTYALKDLLVIELNRDQRGIEVQNQAREGDFAPHFMARAQALRRWGRWYRIALIPLNMRSLNEEARLGGFADHDFMSIHLEWDEAWSQRRRGQVLEALFLFGLGRLDLGLARGEASAILRSVAGRLRFVRARALKLAPSLLDMEIYRVNELSDGDRVRRAYGSIHRLPEREIRALVAAGRALQEAGTRPLFYITPLDQAALSAELPDQGRTLARMTEELKLTLQAEGFEVLDASRMFQGGFFDPGTEHLAAAQRIELARWLANQVLARPPLPRLE